LIWARKRHDVDFLPKWPLFGRDSWQYSCKANSKLANSLLRKGIT
jgi:hypothetical protein